MNPVVDRKSMLGLGLGLAGAGVATVLGMTTDRLLRDRRTAIALDRDGDPGQYDVEPAETHLVLADDGVPLHVEVDLPSGRPAAAPSGSAVPTVVLSHGYTLSLRSWVFQRRALTAAGYRVVLWDQRGHGRSGTGPKAHYDVDQLGRDLGKVIDEVVPDGPIVLVGHSMGGMTMMALAVERPDIVRDRTVGAAFVSTSAGSLETVSWGLGSLLGRMVHRLGPPMVSRLAGRQTFVDEVRDRGREVESFLVDRYSFGSPVPLSVVRLTADMIFGTSMEVISAFLPTFDRHDKADALKEFTGMETLVLVGDQDLLTPASHSEEIIRNLPGAEFVLVADAGHIIMLEHPELVSSQLEEFLTRVLRSAEPPVSEGEGLHGAGVRREVTDLAKKRRDRSARSRGRSAS
ncbi:MAG TPA: alpha/beta hydrolase [Segeticoccus sp.]|uniref:alpha/beta fold hydrolase n=1 Tax=Segeticoccus sp. TaxID=2706531 RepID=UPI002D7F1E30|nr:alpha/beta hydrolase [Segeticoccus sp.]HET8599419.1 alpha/beta hydrolase [Segeticoccus sp.]